MINIQRLIDDAKCYETVRELRWSDGVRCPHCGFTVDRDVNAALNILGLGREAASKR